MKSDFLWTICFLLLVPPPAQAQVDPGGIQAAVDEGMKYPNRAKYLEKGTSIDACKWAGVFSMDGISKEVRFFTDFDVVAAAAAGANGEMRKYGAEEAAKLPLTNVTFANVSMTARGTYPVETLQKKYAAEGVHMVLQIGDSIVQPLVKNEVLTSGSSTQFGTLFQWYEIGGASLLTATPLGFFSEKFQQEFVFAVAPEDLGDRVTAWVIDSEGKRKELSCSLEGIKTLRR